jgi:UDP-2,4-diacetamido-2,4,6-trideoxy-beta-L-altropyranose hydrolase
MDDCQLKLLIRADSGPRIGTGHIMRMLALGQAWKRLRGQTTFVCDKNIPQALVRRISREGFQLFQIANGNGDRQDACDTCEIARAIQPDWIVLDGYRFDDGYQKQIAQTKSPLMVLDDLGHRRHRFADLVLNQSSPTASVSDQAALDRSYLIGPQYALLRSEFAVCEPPIRRPFFAQARRILVNFGGEDPDNWSLRVLRWLSELNQPRLVVDCVIGACYPHADSLVRFKKSANMHLRVHRNVDRMSQLMQIVDLAISATGSTCYELARFGVPTIAIPIAENQKGLFESLQRFNAVIGLPDWRANDEAKVLKTIRQVIRDRELRRKVSEAAQVVVDGQGARRVAQRLASTCYRLRSAQPDDAQLVWSWRNDPEVRAVSFSHDRIPFRQHQAWMHRQIQQENVAFWIAEDKQQRTVGAIRFNLGPDGSSRISIILDPSRRGQGLGTILIRRAAEKLFASGVTDQVVAQVRPINVASERAFRKCGFRLIHPTTINGKVANQYLLARSDIDRPTISDTERLKKSA